MTLINPWQPTSNLIAALRAREMADETGSIGRLLARVTGSVDAPPPAATLELRRKSQNVGNELDGAA
jgi:hypothetical protein